jgi:phosphoserine aminotransferase
MTDLTAPAQRPANPRFSSGPCAKVPGFSLDMLADAPLGRSHRAAVGKAKLKEAIDLTRDILGVPADYRIGIVPGSDTGAVEMAMWSLLGARPVEMLAWESFGEGWVTDVVKQLKLDAKVQKAPYGQIVDFATVDFDKRRGLHLERHHLGLPPAQRRCHPGRPQGPDHLRRHLCRLRDGDGLGETGRGDLLWQKVLGGEGAHGMLILSPRAVERLETYTPAWPLPKIFRLTSKGKVTEGIFVGETINTPSMLAVEDYLVALKWAKSVGGLQGLVNRAKANAQVVWDFCAANPWLQNLAETPEIASTTSVCLKFNDARIKDGEAFRQGCGQAAGKGRRRL